MVSQGFPTSSTLIATFGDFRWVRAHVSVYSVGVVLLVSANLLIGGSRLWSLTAVGIWSIFLFIHLIILAIARLSNELLSDDDEEIVLLPVQDAVIVDPLPAPDPTATWSTVEPARATQDSEAEESELVSWQVATDAAQAKRVPQDKPENDSK